MNSKIKIIKNSVILFIIFSIIICAICLILKFTHSREFGFIVSAEVENEEIVILLMGDSLMEDTIWVEEFSKVLKKEYKFVDFKIIKSAKTGEMSDSAVLRIDKELEKYNPNIVILAYGTNDVNVIHIEKYKNNMELIIQKSLKYNAKVFVNLIGPFEPTALKEKYIYYNFEIVKLSNKLDFEIIDIDIALSGDIEANLADHTHYSDRGSLIVAETVFTSLLEYIKGEIKNE